jgi:hypothetical protein
MNKMKSRMKLLENQRKEMGHEAHASFNHERLYRQFSASKPSSEAIQ